jgi:lysophospholipase L1-like esterase
MSWKLAIVGLSILSFHCVKDPAPVSPTPPAVGNGRRYLALGDSYTIGQSVPDTERFPAQTKKWLAQNGIAVSEPQIIATTGWTTTSLQNAIQSQNPTGPFEWVTLLIGVNDQYQWHDTGGYRDRFLQLLNKSIQLAGGRHNRVFVLSIPDYSVTPFGMSMDTAMIRRQIDQFNAINKAVTAQNNCTYIDITPSTRQAATDPSLIAGDGLHPSGKEYKKWVQLLGPLMKNALQ